MTRTKSPLLVAAVAGLAGLSACTDPGQLGDPNNPNRNRDQGVLLGAATGAALGQIFGGNTEATLGGAVAGAVAGGLIGNNLDKQEAELRASLNNNIGVTNTGDRLIVTMPQDLLFDVDSTALRPDLQADLRTVAASLQNYPDTTVQVIGHTDNTGDAGYNQDLSNRRAGAVANVLIGAGVPSGRIVTQGRGETAPIASNLTPEGRAQNRRVEIVILPTA